MKKHTAFVFAILLSVVCPTALKAAVTEEYNSIEALNDAQEPAVIEITDSEPAAPAAEEATEVVPTPAPKSVAMSRAYEGSVLEAKSYQPDHQSSGLGFTPMLGASLYQGAWGANIRNQHTFGLGVEIPVSRFFAFEIEGSFADYRVSYQHTGGPVVAYAFNQYTLGGNAKVYLLPTKIRPYIGAGMAAMYYNQMSRDASGTGFGARIPYSSLIGAANLMVGVDFALTDSISIGGRAALVVPVLNKPTTQNWVNPVSQRLEAKPGQEETGIINNSLFRLMGTVTVRI